MTGGADQPLHLAGGLTPAAIRQVFARTGRVHIPGIFEAGCAAAIHRTLAEETPWQLSLNPAGRHMDLGVEAVEQIPQPERDAVLEGLFKGVEGSFRYVFNNFPIYDLYMARSFADHYLMRVFEFLNSRMFLDFARQTTGMADIAFADAQATRYRSGHFLTQHDDEVAGKQRRAAYVLSFTPHWRADWGGVLQFIDDDGHVAEGYTPTFNALNLLRVPQKHCVSYVTPAAAASRYSITGWLRAGEPISTCNNPA